jgi:hypothetical protein
MAAYTAEAPLPNHLQAINDLRLGATCQSGYGAVCKTVYPGSIPGVASISFPIAPVFTSLCDWKTGLTAG